MAKVDSSRIEALDAILAEKRKHEGYLAKLEERRASTPANVFGRLRDEYLTKLTDLQVRASMEAESLSEGLKADETAVAEIEARLATITEERLEGELRAEVGEYDPSVWADKLKSLNSSLGKIEKERDAKVTAFERTRALLVEARGAAAAAAAVTTAVTTEPPRVSVPTPTKIEPVVVKPESAAEPVAAPVPAARMTPSPIPTQPPVAPGRTSAAESMPAVPAAAPERVAAPTRTPAAPLEAVAEAMAPAPVAEAAPQVPAPEALAAAPVKPPTPAQGAPMAGSPSFDELAFLNSVVGRVSTPMKAEPPAPRASKPMSEVRDGVPGGAPPAVPPPRPTSTTKPTDEPDTGGLLGRPTPRTSQAIKTLKCQECGTFNYPTEWYCERCGGELAAL